MNGKIEEAKEFRASHEEADDRMMYSIDQIYKAKKTPVPGSARYCITVVSTDADIFVGLLYHLKNTWNGLELYFMKKGHIKAAKTDQKELYPLHLLASKLNPCVVDNLPAGHSLTGCDTVAKVGTKLSLLKILESHSNLISDFGFDRLDEDVLLQAEQFLVKVVASKAYMSCQSFDGLRLKLYHHARQKKLTALSCSSNEIQLNIKRAYLQARMWLESPFGNISEVIDAEEFGYNSLLAPIWHTPPYRPLDIPDPCSSCKSCVRVTCPCRQNDSACSQYCKCGESCKNPLNTA